MLSYSQVEREIYLIFQDDVSYPFSSFMKQGFKHVFAIERQALGWICIDASRNDLATLILPAKYHHEVIEQILKDNKDVKILQLNVMQTHKNSYPRAGIISCTSTMQYLLGVWWPLVITPYQLYNKLINKPPKNIGVNHVR